MTDCLIVLGATAISSSVLLMMLLCLEAIYGSRIRAGTLYGIIKLSLVYFVLPGIFVVWAVVSRSLGRGFYDAGQDGISMMPSKLRCLMIYRDLDDVYSRVLLHTRWRTAWNVVSWWLMGTVMMVVIKRIYFWYRYDRLMKTCTPCREPENLELIRQLCLEYKIGRSFALYENRVLGSPVLVGFWKPKIILPAVELTEEELEIIFRHELTHYKRGDILFRNLVGYVRELNWFHPLIGYFFRIFYDYGEFACDEQVAGQMTASQRSVYARLLIRLYEDSHDDDYAVAFSHKNEGSLKRRIEIIMAGDSGRRSVKAAAVAVLMVIIGCPFVALASSEGSFYIRHRIVNMGIGQNEGVGTEATAGCGNEIHAAISAGAESGTYHFRAKAGDRVKVCVFTDSGSELEDDQAGESMKNGMGTGSFEDEKDKDFEHSHKWKEDHTYEIKKDGLYSIWFENTGEDGICVRGAVHRENCGD